jgi:uncharacterized protein (TIGR03067 family)
MLTRDPPHAVAAGPRGPALALLALALPITLAAPAPAPNPVATPAGRASDDPTGRDLAALQGVWRLETQVVNGVRSPDERTRPWVLVVEGDIYNPGSRDSSVEYQMRIDAARNPHAIDFIPKDGQRRGRPLRGIYRLADDRFTICRVLDPDLDRPTAFEAADGSNLVLLVWRRAEP